MTNLGFWSGKGPWCGTGSFFLEVCSRLRLFANCCFFGLFELMNWELEVVLTNLVIVMCKYKKFLFPLLFHQKKLRFFEMTFFP